MDFKFFRILRIIGLVGTSSVIYNTANYYMLKCLSCLQEMSQFVLKIVCHE